MDTLNKIDIIRVSISSYQRGDFQETEKKTLEKEFNLNYTNTIDENKDHILITNSNTDTSTLPVSKNTKLIIHPNSGYDNFSYDFVNKCPCPIIIGNEIRMNAVVNYTISALLDSLNSMKDYPAWDNSRQWDRDLLETKNILIIGQGHIGTKVKDIVTSLGGSPKVYDPFKGYKIIDFNNVDIILLCASLNPTSEKMINEDVFKNVSKNLLIINGARGKLIDQRSLIDFLKTNNSSYAYLDVFDDEPFDEADFKDLTNVCRSSHVAGVHNQLNSNIISFESKIIESFINAKTLQHFKKENKESLLQERMRESYLI